MPPNTDFLMHSNLLESPKVKFICLFPVVLLRSKFVCIKNTIHALCVCVFVPFSFSKDKVLEIIKLDGER